MNGTEIARLIVAEATGASVDEISAASDMFSVAGWDSIAHMKIILAAEARLGARLAPDLVVNLTSVRDLIGLFSPDQPR
ncbi:MAG: acyl carrier protein [Paracoccaceae bacterium]